ncbi:hypothetical protein G4223_12630 [Magnetospirillum aberrantis SpK]|uniref:Uncharacterized protein n=1 Tax=Magnetospirillum aberrantis SpK TaxID=908842 RepID=A0A7C9QWH1_9PROT|nr:hypothetical protein [Magnetospirillum aberrantis SpK]
MMMSLFQAWQQCPRMSSYEVKARLDSQFSTGLSCGYLGGKGIRVMLSGTGQVGCEVPSGLVKHTVREGHRDYVYAIKADILG